MTKDARRCRAFRLLGEGFGVVGWGGFGLFGVNGHERFFFYHAPDEESYAEEYERDAEELAHVEKHVLLEAHLRFLDELYQETHSEEHHEECSYDGTFVEFVPFCIVECHQYQSENEVAEALIQLCRVLGQGFASEVEDEAPWKGGDISVDLGVEEVAQSDGEGCEADGDAEMVEYPEEVEVMLFAVMLCKPPHCYEKRYGTSMAGESSFPRHEDFPEAFPAAQVVVGLIEKAVSQTRSHDCAYEQGIEQRVKEFRTYLLLLEEHLEDVPSEDET